MSKIIVFDLDGTLADTKHREHFLQQTPKNWAGWHACQKDDIPNKAVEVIFRKLAQSYDIEIWTARSEKQRIATLAWLDQYDMSKGFTVLRMRPDICKKDDDQLKQQWLLNHRQLGGEVLMVFEDRKRVVDMWRRNGVTCFQVAEGEF